MQPNGLSDVEESSLTARVHNLYVPGMYLKLRF